MMANLLRTRVWDAPMGATVSCGGGASNGLKGFLFSEDEECGGFGLLAREGEKRSWN